MILPQILDVSAKGEILIPAVLRKALGIKPKGKIFLYPVIEDKKILIEPIEEEDIIEMAYGMLKKKKGEKPMTEKLLEERKRDLIREETKFDSLYKKKK